MKDRFLSPPLTAVYSSTGIEWAKDDKEASYLSLFQNIALNGSLLPKHANTKFPKGVLNDCSCSSTKDSLTDRVCMYCGLYFGNLKSKQNHSSYCQTKESRAVGDEYFGIIKSKQNHSSYCQTKESRAGGDEQHSGTRKVRPQRVAAHRQKDLLCAMEFQELEWHAVDDVDFNDAEAYIPEIVHESGTPVLDGMEPVCTSD